MTGTGWYRPTGASAAGDGTARAVPPTTAEAGPNQSLIDRNARLRAAQKEIDLIGSRLRVAIVVLALGVLLGVLALVF